MIAGRLALLMVSAVVTPSASTAVGQVPTRVVSETTKPQSGSRSRLPAFAVQLADKDAITGPSGWPRVSTNAAWSALAAATPETRQSARWAYARSLIGINQGQEALGVLDTMRADDPDLALVANFRLALGAARAQMGDARGAIAALGASGPGDGVLASNPEACAWRLLSLASLGDAAAALGQIRCSFAALNARSLAARAPFLYAGARAALAAGRPQPVFNWLQALPDRDGEANLYRGRAALALGDLPTARMRLSRAKSGSRQFALDAEISLLEADLAKGDATPAQLARLDQLALVWRGDTIEQRVLQLSYRTGRKQHDIQRSLASGSALVRYFPDAPGLQVILGELQQLLCDGLSPQSPVPIGTAAGLYWDYRDLAPAGARGDFLVGQLAERLQQHGLYARAAELLHHQLTARTYDIAKGPLSAQVAGLYILADKPEIALQVLGASEGPSYPAEMQWQRQRMAAVALFRLGRRAEALAAVQDVPDAAMIRSEIRWQGREWPALVAEMAPQLPRSSRFSAVEQAMVLRYTIALAMLGRETELARLRLRYQSAFAGLPGAAAFDLLTGNLGSLGPEALTAAMLAIPSVSPAGAIGDLLDRPAVRSSAPLSTQLSANSRQG